MKNNPPFPLKHKKFDWGTFWKKNSTIAAELRALKEQEARKHCPCCPAHPEYEELDHSSY
jgi:hypothetical protein